MKRYTADKDHSKLEPYYSLHVAAMTGEQLFEKSDIAAELAARDLEIRRLRDGLAIIRTIVRDDPTALIRINALLGE